MKTIIAGSRQLDIYQDQYKVWVVADAVIKSGFDVTEVVSGGCRGIDLAGEAWARAMIPPIPIKPFQPDWEKHGKAAGPIRNGEMADYADALILIWNGTSRGSADMKKKAEQKGLKIYEYLVS